MTSQEPAPRRTVVVTGTSSGIGRATVEHFAAAGWNVVATVRRPSELPGFDALPRVATELLDVNDAPAVEGFLDRALSHFGSVDVLVNNAGYCQMGPLEATTMDQVRNQFETNVFGLIAVTRPFIPYFRRRRTGTIVNVASISAENGYPFTSVYAASKAAVATLTDSLNVELSQFGVVVKAVYPGQHATRIFTKLDLATPIPDDYRPLLERFTSAQAGAGGSSPTVSAAVILRAATDGRPDRTRYDAGPDATPIPRAKRLLGSERYFATVKTALLDGPGPIARRLARSGTEPMDVDLSALRIAEPADRRC